LRRAPAVLLADRADATLGFMSQAIRARWQLWWQRRKKAQEPSRPPLRARFKAWFERTKPQGARAAESPRDAETIADRAEAKVVRQGKLRQAWSDIQVLVRLVRAWARGDYRDVSKGTIGLILGALVYFVTPIDAIIDHLPFAGFLDDAAILAWVISEVRAEIEAFKAWEAKQLPAVPTGPALGPADGSGTP
jgi:uncharacterized membrane protein YkvA (DUF1232 family)